MKDDIQKYKEKYGKAEGGFEMQLKKEGFNRSVGLFFIENVGTYVCNDIKETIYDLKAYSLNGKDRADLFVAFANGYIPSVCTYLLEQYFELNMMKFMI